MIAILLLSAPANKAIYSLIFLFAVISLGFWGTEPKEDNNDEDNFKNPAL